jgi:hypothetical protein
MGAQAGNHQKKVGAATPKQQETRFLRETGFLVVLFASPDAMDLPDPAPECC